MYVFGGFLVIFAVLTAIVFRQNAPSAAVIDARWAAAARRLGLALNPDSRSISGDHGGVALAVSEFEVRSDKGGSNTCIWVEARAPGCLRLSAEKRDFLGQAWWGPAEVRTADVAFDSLVSVIAPLPGATAALNSQTRKLLRELVVAGGRVKDGWVQFGLAGSVEVVAPKLLASIGACLELARRLALREEDTCAALAANAAADRDLRVRSRNLEALAHHFPLSEETAMALDAALGAEDPQTAFEAARLGKGPKGRECLTGLVTRVPGEIPALALQFLLDEYPWDGLGAVVAMALESEVEQLQIVAARSLSLGGKVEQLELFACEEPRQFTPAVEAALIKLLSSGSAGRLAAAIALGNFGSLAAVEQLLRLASGLRSRGAIRRAAREAIERIQKRSGRGGREGTVALAQIAEPRGALTTSTPSEPSSDGRR